MITIRRTTEPNTENDRNLKGIPPGTAFTGIIGGQAGLFICVGIPTQLRVVCLTNSPDRTLHWWEVGFINSIVVHDYKEVDLEIMVKERR